MVYYVIEGKIEESFKYNAGSKARQDVEYILNKRGFEKLYVDTVKTTIKNKLMKWKQFLLLKNNTKNWDKSLSKLNQGDTVIIQYPLTNSTYKLKNVIKKYKGKITFILLIHDLNSIRTEKSNKMSYKKLYDEDKNLLNQMDYIISHNSSMKKVLLDYGNKDEKVLELQLFDYIVDNVEYKERNINDPIVIAGNLSPFKVGYLKYLKDIKCNFNLYGVGFDEENKSENIEYKGKFLPDELVNKLEGGFGLVWDGTSINTCTTKMGEYLKYNNPHKVSLYLLSGLPVIVWSKSALAGFIKDNKLGIAIDDLSLLDQEINKLTNDDYNKMVENTRTISKKLQSGYFLNEALNKILNRGQDGK